MPTIRSCLAARCQKCVAEQSNTYERLQGIEQVSATYGLATNEGNASGGTQHGHSNAMQIRPGPSVIVVEEAHYLSCTRDGACGARNKHIICYQDALYYWATHACWSHTNCPVKSNTQLFNAAIGPQPTHAFEGHVGRRNVGHNE